MTQSERAATAPSLADPSKCHVGGLGGPAIGIVPIANHQTVLGSHAEQLRSSQIALRMRLEPARSVRFATGDDHVEQRLCAEGAKLVASWVVADERGSPTLGSKCGDLFQQSGTPGSPQPLAWTLEHPLANAGLDHRGFDGERFGGAPELRREGIVTLEAFEPGRLLVSQKLVLEPKTAQRPNRSPAAEQELAAHGELYEERRIKSAVEVDEPGLVARAAQGVQTLPL
jgi:hypothetical protein